MDKFEKYVKKAKENRKKFLRPYRKRFDGETSVLKRAEILQELIEIEPSHMLEPWINYAIYQFLTDLDYNYHVEKIIRPVNYKKNMRKIKDGMIYNKIERMRAQKRANNENESIRSVIREIINNFPVDEYKANIHERYKLVTDMWKGFKIDDLDEEALRLAYNRHKDRLRKDKVPSPYYGREVAIKGAD